MILYGWRGRHKFYAKQGTWSTCIFADAPNRSVYHPTTKPVALLGQLLGATTTRGMIVYDPFSGSGSCLVAAEKLGRVAYLAELAANYAACILERAVVECGLAPYLETETKNTTEVENEKRI